MKTALGIRSHCAKHSNTNTQSKTLYRGLRVNDHTCSALSLVINTLETDRAVGTVGAVSKSDRDLSGNDIRGGLGHKGVNSKECV